MASTLSPTAPGTGSDEPVKPRWRGVLHQWSVLVAIVLGAALVVAADTTRGRIGVGIYALGVVGLFGISALYHRVTWSPTARRRMRRADHSMIFVFIAASYTPIALLVLSDPLRTAILAVVWGLAMLGIGLQFLWVDAPKWVHAVLYVGLGWVSVATMPQILDELGGLAAAGLGAGGVLYTVGAVVYARGRPDPVPHVFGYHEVFHLLVCLAALTHYVVIAAAVVPRG